MQQGYWALTPGMRPEPCFFSVPFKVEARKYLPEG